MADRAHGRIFEVKLSPAMPAAFADAAPMSPRCARAVPRVCRTRQPKEFPAVVVDSAAFTPVAGIGRIGIAPLAVVRAPRSTKS